MLLHLDIKEPGLQDELAAMLEQMDMWDHVVTVNKYNSSRLRPPANTKDRDPNAPYNKVHLMSYKGWAPTPDGPEEESIETIRKWLPTKPGKQMVFCSDPRPVARAMDKKAPKPHPTPNKLRAWWGPKGILKSPTNAERNQKKAR